MFSTLERTISSFSKCLVGGSGTFST
jgi:hypothetical protein